MTTAKSAPRKTAAKKTTAKRAVKKAPAKKTAAKRPTAQFRQGAVASNGLKSFALHSLDASSKPAVNAMAAARAAQPVFAFAGGAGPQAMDPETAARGYLEQALASDATPQFALPVANKVPSEFKSLGTEAIPLTGTTTVKFRQTFGKIPVYGSLVTVELDMQNQLIGINSALGTPIGVKPVASISAANAVSAVKAYPGYSKKLDGVVPRLNYYYDNGASKWRLVFILEDVPVVPDKKGPSPVLMDYVVDAHTGKVVTATPRTPTAATSGTGIDGLGETRTFETDKTGNVNLMKDSTLNVQTFDFGFRDPVTGEALLPGKPIKNPPVFSPSAVSAHANAEAVSLFLRNVLKRNNIDNQGGLMRSSINCVDRSDSPDGKQWVNAFWNGRQMVYGQRLAGTTFLSMSVALDVVGHEMFHGVTDKTSRLEYAKQSGALNESYSDIFGIIIANNANPNPVTWNWLIGAGLTPSGAPFRDMSDPTRFNQPDNMKSFVVLPNTPNGDNGGVHINSGIHNKAAFNVLVAKKAGKLAFKPQEVAAIFYLALTQRLSRTSQFADSRRAVLDSARTLFRALPAAELASRITAIEGAFSAVGIN
ncbi:M4 family metallopeptidase [Variovorax sp. WS11]|uniref:M4 family metallopeptidase n=1 Tax=Variovorax sp. WS11 TaxID=1105204 RepID=UPI0013DA7F13|nr:M4 family metallopeptidase [Variovorax sp. WS11]NDZ17795.1 M4 family metallopeptidase [Variovorax sp. WS11]